MPVLIPADCSKQMQQPPGWFGRQWWNTQCVERQQHDIFCPVRPLFGVFQNLKVYLIKHAILWPVGSVGRLAQMVSHVSSSSEGHYIYTEQDLTGFNPALTIQPSHYYNTLATNTVIYAAKQTTTMTTAATLHDLEIREALGLWGPKFDLVATLIIIPRPSKLKLLIFGLNYIVNQSLVKFLPLLTNVLELAHSQTQRHSTSSPAQLR